MFYSGIKSVNLQIKALSEKVDSKQMPYVLEDEIVKAAQQAIGKSIAEALGGYNSVLLNKIAKTVVSGIDGSIDKTINLMKQDAIFRSRLTLSVKQILSKSF